MFATIVSKYTDASGSKRYKFSAYTTYSVEIICLDITPDNAHVAEELLKLDNSKPVQVNSGLTIELYKENMVTFNLHNGIANQPVQICLSYESCKPSFAKLRELLN
jgi:hypothetical protein